MSSTQSVPASDASKAQVDAAAHAVEALVLQDEGDQGHHNADDDGEEGDEDDNDHPAEAVAGSSTAAQDGESAAAGKKKKKKSKSKGKGKAALDKLKGALTGNDSGKGVELDNDDASSNTSSSVAGKKPIPPISDALYKRILEEAKKNLSPEEAAKLDRQAVAEMVECEFHD